MLPWLLLIACQAPQEPPKHQKADWSKASASPPETTRGMDRLFVGGGADPASSPFALQQDIASAEKALGGEGLVLFAGGPRSYVARLRDDEPASVKEHLALLYGSYASTDLSYVHATLQIDAPATRPIVMQTLRGLLEKKGDPLWMVFAGHGEPGQTSTADNAIVLWGDGRITVSDMQRLLDRPKNKRPMRMINTACFGGAFAEVAVRPATETVRDFCGFFAAPPGEKSSGCDPDPDRLAQEAYSVHLWAALEGTRKDGTPLPADADADGDGKLSLLEAHHWAAAHAHSIDIPLTTSEAWLARWIPYPEQIPDLPEHPLYAPERALIATLSKELGTTDHPSTLRALDAVAGQLDALAEELDVLAEAEDAAWRAHRVALLHRWPVLDDAWHPDFDRALAAHEDEIRQALNLSPTAVQLEQAQDAAEQGWKRWDALRVRRAMLMRLAQAWETLFRAHTLSSGGDDAWEDYLRLRECESEKVVALGSATP